MRLRLLLAPLCAAILGSCAYQGTIVQKDATPLPFDQSYGLDGSYAFLLRDNAGALHRQIVTAEVYNGYAIGEYFNDLEPRRATDGKSFDGKTVMTAMMSKVTTRRSLATRTPTQKAKVARATKANKCDVKVAKQTRPSIKPKQPTRVATAVAEPARRALPVEKPIELPSKLLNPRPVWDSDLAYVSVPRCR
jgi:hypothetical protein